MFDVVKEILTSEKGFTQTNYKSLQKAWIYIEKNLIDFDDGMYLTFDSLIVINNIINGSKIILL